MPIMNHIPRVFKGQSLCTRYIERRYTLPIVKPYLRMIRFQGPPDRKREERTLPRIATTVPKFVYVTVKLSGIKSSNIKLVPFRHQHDLN